MEEGELCYFSLTSSCRSLFVDCRRFTCGDRRAIPCQDNQLFMDLLNAMDVEDLLFQQDGATCHTANARMALLNEKFAGRIITQNSEVNWPPRSCDLASLDFFLWGHLKNKVYANKPTTIQQLKDEIIRHIGEIEERLSGTSSKILTIE